MLSRLLTLLLLQFLFTISINAQDKRDIGLQLGGTYYYGDFNERTPLYKPSFSLGVIFRYNINNYYSLRGSAIYGKVAGSYNSSSYLPNLTTSQSFSKTLLGFEVMGEFNFLNFNPTNERKGKFSPFVNLGIGISQIGGGFFANIPFSIGMKYTPGQRHTVSIEWRFHKTFTDKIDEYSAPVDNRKVFIHNNDWVSFAGVIYTYRLFNNNNICPVYK
ncbi:MAG: outer membrane beta-barrel protein [Bacteroidales bacterium]|nr:MAG: outer membrane beta-barrel protein [Bacteroidales bacterium]